MRNLDSVTLLVLMPQCINSAGGRKQAGACIDGLVESVDLMSICLKATQRWARAVALPREECEVTLPRIGAATSVSHHQLSCAHYQCVF
eukprot:3098123-Amphidinium_carterae.1